MDLQPGYLHNAFMLDINAIAAQDLRSLSPASLAEVAGRMLAHIGVQSRQIGVQSRQIDEQARAIKFKDTKLERITFELARLKAWRFAAKTEAMNAEQRQMFEETLAEDQASLEAQLLALQAQAVEPPAQVEAQAKRKPKRQVLPEHLRRVEHHLPEDPVEHEALHLPRAPRQHAVNDVGVPEVAAVRVGVICDGAEIPAIGRGLGDDWKAVIDWCIGWARKKRGQLCGGRLRCGVEQERLGCRFLSHSFSVSASDA